MMHELIDRDYPVCLYCNTQCEIFYSGSQLPKSALTIEHESLTCTACKEVFVINWFQKSDGETIYTGFDFTCKDYQVSINYMEDVFEIKTKAGEYITALPPFPVDFSDKKKLREKLKTYVIFS